MKQTKQILEMAIDSQQEIIAECKAAKDPGTSRAYDKAKIRLEVLEAVLKSLEGDHVLLRTYI